MAVSEEDVEEEEVIHEDFQRAEAIFSRIIKEKGRPGLDFRPLLFALCLIYCRQLRHRKHEETDSRHEHEGK